jgi:5S rRNA maturation endonuclease (ribonuclease M5)
MGNKRDIRIFIVPILIFFVFLFGIIGYRQLMGSDFSLAGAIYSTLFFFILNNIAPGDATSNVYLLISRYLAALMLGFGIYSLLYKHLRLWYTLLKVKYRYQNHVIVFSMKLAGENFVDDLLANNYQVILVEGTTENASLEKIEKKGIIVFQKDEHTSKFFDALLVSRASACIIASDNDSMNMELSLKLISYLRGKGHRRSVKVLTHIAKRNNLEVIKDHIDISNADENFDFEIFNIASAAAKKIYDHFPPHNYFNFDQPDENAIAIVGYNAAAEDFILENIILSHYKDCHNIKIYLVEKDADHHLNQFMYQYPFCREFVDIVPLKMLNNKFFANFNWSKELIEKLSKAKAVYFFGNEGSELMNLAVRFRQFLSGQVTNYLSAPIVICFPEDTPIMNLLDAERENSEKLSTIFKEQLNINFVNMVSDTCTSNRLLEESEYIDLLSRVINYYYSVKYEFEGLLKQKYNLANAAELVSSIENKLLELSGKNARLGEREVEELVLQKIAEASGKEPGLLKPEFGIKRWWDHLSYHKKSANRYAARHLAVKINIMKNVGSMPFTNENILNSFPILAPIEHKRWSAEKMVLNYRYGVLPKERIAKENAKERLKIHDQLVPYEKLSDFERQKDLNIFLLMPLLNSLKVEIKK